MGTAPHTVTDELGAEMEVPSRPERIVSLVPSLSEALWWVGAADRIVGVTEHCVAPPDAYTRAQRVRGTKNPDVDAIVALEPDLVVANEEENRELDVRRMRDAGVTVYVTAPRTVHQAADTLAGLGGLVDAGKPGQGLRTDILRAVDAARGLRPYESLETFCPIWRDPWMATGRDTYAGDLLSLCGYAVLPADPGGRYPVVELDAIAARRPEVVLLPDEPYVFGEGDRDVFAAWGARVRLLDGTQLTWYGPRTPYALTELARQARMFAHRR